MEISIEYMIGQCNNFYKFWQLFQSLIGPLVEERIASDAEIQEEYNERLVINTFNTIQDMLIATVTDMIFTKKLPDYNQNRAIQGYFDNK
jgi:hypothetical protein